MCKNAVKNLPFVIMYVPNQNNPHEMCDKAILENCGLLRFIPNCYKN